MLPEYTIKFGHKTYTVTKHWLNKTGKAIVYENMNPHGLIINGETWVVKKGPFKGEVGVRQTRPYNGKPIKVGTVKS